MAGTRWLDMSRLVASWWTGLVASAAAFAAAAFVPSWMIVSLLRIILPLGISLLAQHCAWHRGEVTNLVQRYKLIWERRTGRRFLGFHRHAAGKSFVGKIGVPRSSLRMTHLSPRKHTLDRRESRH